MFSSKSKLTKFANLALSSNLIKLYSIFWLYIGESLPDIGKDLPMVLSGILG